MRSPYEAALDTAFRALPSEIQRAHAAPLRATGSFDVAHGSHWATGWLVKLLKLPAAGVAQLVLLEVSAWNDELLWARRIGAVSCRTRQRAVGPRIIERAGLGAIVFNVSVSEDALLYRQHDVRFAGVSIPRVVAPFVSARVSAAPGGWHVAVSVTWRAHLVCRYSGRMSVV